MPLDWLGQLSPTMQQQIALQRALLALQREDEQIRAKTMPQAMQPALARGLGAGPGPAIPGGPSYREQPPSPLAAGPAAVGHFRPGAGSLEEALRAATPATGSAIDIQAQAWARRKEMGEERVVGAKEAYDRIITLDPNGQKIALNALRKYKSGVYKAMETEGYISPTGVLAEPKQEATSVHYETADNGELIALTTYPDGRVEVEHTGVYPAVEAEEAAGPTISESIAMEKLGMEMGEYAERHRTAAIKVMGDMPRPGIDTVNIEGKDVPATVEHANAWLEGVNALTAYLSAQAGEAPPEGEVKMSDVKAQYEGRPDLIGDIQDKLGIPRTEVWDEETERQFYLYGEVDMRGVEGEPAEGEAKPKFERQKKFWADWVKTWGKILRVKGVNIGGLTREEWEAKKGGQ